jgi:hypothetical protein
MDAEVSTHTFLTMIIEESVCFMSSEAIFFFAIILMWYTPNMFVVLQVLGAETANIKSVLKRTAGTIF